MEYVLLYVDDVLVISENAEVVLRNEIGQHWRLKEGSIGKHVLYLGGKCREVELWNGVKCWAFSSSQYVQAAVKNVQEWLAKQNRTLPKKAEAPFKSGYHPEIDISRELGPVEAPCYMPLIGVCTAVDRWARSCWYLFGSFYDEQSSCYAEIRSFGVLESHVLVLE